MLGHHATDHHLMGVHEDFLQWVREGAGPAGVDRVTWLDNPFAFHTQRDISLDPRAPETIGHVRLQARAAGIILLAPSWREWHRLIGADWAPWERGVDCTVYDWNGNRIGTDSWPPDAYEVGALNLQMLAGNVRLLGMPDATPLDRLRARFTIARVG